MKFHRIARARMGAVLIVLWALTSASAFAAPADYRFELVEARSAGAGKMEVAVRIVRIPDGKPVTGAVFTQSKTDMGPSGMVAMTGKVTPLTSDQPGIYRFQAETGMAGKWGLILAAKIQGETGPVSGSVAYDVAK